MQKPQVGSKIMVKFLFLFDFYCLSREKNFLFIMNAICIRLNMYGVQRLFAIINYIFIKMFDMLCSLPVMPKNMLGQECLCRFRVSFNFLATGLPGSVG